MAIGFSPKSQQELNLEELSVKEFLTIAVFSAKKLGWDIGHISELGFIAYTKISMSSWTEEVTVKIEENVAYLKSECTGSQLVDWGKNRRNIEKLIFSIQDLKSVFTAEDIDAQYAELREGFAPREEDILRQTPMAGKEKVMNFFSVFKPVPGYFVTPILINLNIVIFILMALSGASILLPSSKILLDWGANFRPLTLEGQWWRMITCCFLHIGIIHLVMNMYAFLYIGLLLEPYLGRARFLSAYLFTGILASVTSLSWHQYTISAGASGAIFGMYGFFLAMLTTDLIERAARRALLTSIGVFVAFNLINGLKGGVDNAAHIGGLLSGIVLGYVFVGGIKRAETKKSTITTISVVALFVIAASFLVLTNLPNEVKANMPYNAELKISNDVKAFETKMKDFTIMEKMALEFYGMPKGSSDEELLFNLNDRGIYYWNENINLLNEVDNLNLPDVYHERIQIMKEYCELRIKVYELFSKEIKEGKGKYRNEIKDYNKQIEAIFAKLKSNK